MIRRCEWGCEWGHPVSQGCESKSGWPQRPTHCVLVLGWHLRRPSVLDSDFPFGEVMKKLITVNLKLMAFGYIVGIALAAIGAADAGTCCTQLPSSGLVTGIAVASCSSPMNTCNVSCTWNCTWPIETDVSPATVEWGMLVLQSQAANGANSLTKLTGGPYVITNMATCGQPWVETNQSFNTATALQSDLSSMNCLLPCHFGVNMNQYFYNCRFVAYYSRASCTLPNGMTKTYDGMWKASGC